MTLNELAAELRLAQDDINAVRKDLKGKGPFEALLERAAVKIETAIIAARTDNIG